MEGFEYCAMCSASGYSRAAAISPTHLPFAMPAHCASDTLPQALLLALSLWPVMSPQLLATCPLLPKGCPAPAAAVFFPPASQPKQGKSALQQQQQGGPFDFLGQQQPGYEAPSAACCDALFSTTYLQAVLPALQVRGQRGGRAEGGLGCGKGGRRMGRDGWQEGLALETYSIGAEVVLT